MSNSVRQLEEMGMSDARYVLGYCHGGHLSMWKQRYLDFSMLNTDNMEYVMTSESYRECLGGI